MQAQHSVAVLGTGMLFQPSTKVLKVQHTPGFGYKGLQALVQEVLKWEGTVCELEELDLRDSKLGGGQGGSMTEASLDQLTQFLPLLPSLQVLDLRMNDLDDLPSSFITVLLSLPNLKDLRLQNNHLGHYRNPSAPCAMHRFFSELSVTASSSRLNIRQLALDFCGVGQCCFPVLVQILSLGSKGLRALDVTIEPELIHQVQNAVETVCTHNMYIRGLRLIQNGACNWRPTQWTLSGLLQRLEGALERNKQIQLIVHHTAFKMLKLARVILLPSRSALPRGSSRRSRVLDFPFEILQLVFCALFPGLSARQVGSILRYAGDRKTLRRIKIKRLDPSTLSSKARKRANRHQRSNKELQQRQVLEKIDCWEYDL